MPQRTPPPAISPVVEAVLATINAQVRTGSAQPWSPVTERQYGSAYDDLDFNEPVYVMSSRPCTFTLGWMADVGTVLTLTGPGHSNPAFEVLGRERYTESDHPELRTAYAQLKGLAGVETVERHALRSPVLTAALRGSRLA